MTNTTLKPCPFCGGETEVCEGGINGRMQIYGLVEHKDGCFFLADGLPSRYQHIMECDFDAWNKRAERTCRDLGGCDAAGMQVFCCSECGCVLSLFDVSGINTLCTNHIYDYPRYCPNCGAKAAD